MKTNLVILFKDKKVYRAVFEAGNGGAWNNWYILHKKAKDDKEALQWARNVVIGNRWAEDVKTSSSKWLKLLFNDSKIIEPEMAGFDYGGYDDKERFLIDGGFELSLSCEKPDKCKLRYNSGTRKYPKYKEIYLPKPQYKYFISFGSGRSYKETIYIMDMPKNVIWHDFEII